ncbi:hypothetical protein [Mesorhizobium amorphae]|uniref:hypothetical protein n=1 Tax=Mesorhizobium amorphae TaxID=71433 RepID=UPI001783E85C|nr:hypothetical protein [Mesorhizobium amorphae]
MSPAKFNRRAEEGGAQARMERPLAIANGEILYRLTDQNGKKLKPGGEKRTMMTSQAVLQS